MTRGRPISRANMPTARYDGNFSQTRITNGTIQPIIDPNDGPAVPRQYHPCQPHQCVGSEDAAAAAGQRHSNPAVGQEWTSNSMYDLTPIHGRTNHVLRVDGVLSDKTRFNVKVIKDRDDDWSWNRITPEHRVREPEHARPAAVDHDDQGAQAHDRQRNQLRIRTTAGASRQTTTSTTRAYARSTLGIDPPRFEPFGAYNDPPTLGGFGESQVDEWPYAPGSARPVATGPTWRTIAWRTGTSVSRRADSPTQPERPVRLRQRSVDDRRPAQHQDGCCPRVQPEDGAGFRRLHGEFQLRPRREQSPEHRQRLREHAARRLRPTRS